MQITDSRYPTSSSKRLLEIGVGLLCLWIDEHVIGAIGFRPHWEESENENLFVVSEALVRAVAIEKSVKAPAVVISEEISLGIASLVDKYGNSDVTLDQMLKSYQNSVKDPDNEFVHLYEIRDSLSERFGSRKAQ